MPNWCNNNTTVRGSGPEIARLWDAMELESPFVSEYEGEVTHRISNLMPMPAELEDTTSPSPSSPDPDPNWANLLANGEISKEWHDTLVADRARAYHEAERNLAEHGYRNWWDWQLAHWGVKWGDSSLEYEMFIYNEDGTDRVDDAELELKYETPWGPFADEFFAHISKEFPTLTFVTVYEEPGMCFAGGTKFQNGKLVANNYVNYGDMLEKLTQPDDDENHDGWDEFYALSDKVRSDAVEQAEREVWFLPNSAESLR